MAQTRKPLTAQQRRAISLVKNLLYARRSHNVMREQREYDTLYAWTAKQNLDFTNVVSDVTRWLKQNDVAAIMNSLV